MITLGILNNEIKVSVIVIELNLMLMKLTLLISASNGDNIIIYYIQ